MTAHDAVTLGIPGSTSAMARVMAEIVEERVRQEARWGQQDHPDGTGPDLRFDELPLDGVIAECSSLNAGPFSEWARERCEDMHDNGEGTYEAILTEEYAEAIAAQGAELRAELVEVAAVAAAWVEKIDRQAATS